MSKIRVMGIAMNLFICCIKISFRNSIGWYGFCFPTSFHSVRCARILSFDVVSPTKFSVFWFPKHISFNKHLNSTKKTWRKLIRSYFLFTFGLVWLIFWNTGRLLLSSKLIERAQQRWYYLLRGVKNGFDVEELGTWKFVLRLFLEVREWDSLNMHCRLCGSCCVFRGNHDAKTCQSTFSKYCECGEISSDLIGNGFKKLADVKKR